MVTREIVDAEYTVVTDKTRRKVVLRRTLWLAFEVTLFVGGFAVLAYQQWLAAGHVWFLTAMGVGAIALGAMLLYDDFIAP